MLTIIVLVGAILLTLSGAIYSVLTSKRRRDEADKLGLPSIRLFERSWVPITLVPSVELQEYEEEILSVVRRAAHCWNEKTKLSLFVDLGELAQLGSVVPILRAPENSEHQNALAYTRLVVDRRGALESAALYLTSKGLAADKASLERAMKHELGHCLGLDHDDIPESVMYGVALSRSCRITEKDIEFLQEIYG